MQTLQSMTSPLLALAILISGLASIAAAQQNNDVAGEGERLIKAAPPTNVSWSDADRALRKAMETEDALTQKAAIAQWMQFLERDDLSKGQRSYAWWNIGALYGYRLDPNSGESSDYGKAERAYAKTRELLGELVTRESLNSATVWASIPGTAEQEVKRLAIAYKWLFTRSEEDINKSAKLVNTNGYLIDQKFVSNNTFPRDTVSEMKEFLRKQLAQSRKSITETVTGKIWYSQDPEAIAELLESIEEVADPKQMEQWRVMHRELAEKFSRRRDGADSKKD